MTACRRRSCSFVLCVLETCCGEQKYAAQAGLHQQRAQEIYTELRKNIIDNVHKVRCGAPYAAHISRPRVSVGVC